METYINKLTKKEYNSVRELIFSDNDELAILLLHGLGLTINEIIMFLLEYGKFKFKDRPGLRYSNIRYDNLFLLEFSLRATTNEPMLRLFLPVKNSKYFRFGFKISPWNTESKLSDNDIDKILYYIKPYIKRITDGEVKNN